MVPDPRVPEDPMFFRVLVVVVQGVIVCVCVCVYVCMCVPVQTAKRIERRIDLYLRPKQSHPIFHKGPGHLRYSSRSQIFSSNSKEDRKKDRSVP